MTPIRPAIEEFRSALTDAHAAARLAGQQRPDAALAARVDALERRLRAAGAAGDAILDAGNDPGEDVVRALRAMALLLRSSPPRPDDP